VRAAFIANSRKPPRHSFRIASGQIPRDIYLLARQRLNALGITRIFGGDYCTYPQELAFFSYRRDGVTGRMGTFIWLA